MDIRPTEHPAQAASTRLDLQWPTYRFPDPRASAHPFDRLDPGNLTWTPAALLTSACDYNTLLIWFNSRGGDAVAPVLKAGEWVNIFAMVGGMSGTL
jgi:hypothetical protein